MWQRFLARWVGLRGHTAYFSFVSIVQIELIQNSPSVLFGNS